MTIAINHLTGHELREMFKYDSINRSWRSDELGIVIQPKPRSRHIVTIDRTMVPVEKEGNQRIVSYHGQRINIEVLLSVLHADEDNFHLSSYINNLMTYVNYFHLAVETNEVVIRKLISKFFDIYNAETNEVEYQVNMQHIYRVLQCNSGTIWDLVHKTNAGKIGYHGYFIRSHIPEEVEPFVIDEIDLQHNRNYADDAGIYLIVKADCPEHVRVTNSATDLVNYISEVMNVVSTVKDLDIYFEREDLSETFHGFYIRRVDDIFGLNVRFSDLTLLEMEV